MNITLPKLIQNQLFLNFSANYSPNYKEAQQNLDADEDKLRNYLGTYFPRSFAETYYITESLLSSDVILKKINNKKDCKILDIGSGTGGNLLGFLSAMRKYTDIVNIPINLISVDGNQAALSIQEKIVKECFDGKINFNHQNISFSYRNQFALQLTDICQNNDPFDIILCSKSLSELYLSPKFEEWMPMWNNEGYYSDLFEVAGKFLKSDGLLILMDVTVKVPTINLNISKIINAEYDHYIHGVNKKLKCILPISCALWSVGCLNSKNCFHQKIIKVNHHFKNDDISKFTCKVLAMNSYADKISMTFPSDVSYQVADGSIKSYCFKGRYYHENEKMKMRDSFYL